MPRRDSLEQDYIALSGIGEALISKQKQHQRVDQRAEEDEEQDPNTKAQHSLEHPEPHLFQVGEPFMDNQVFMVRSHGVGSID